MFARFVFLFFAFQYLQIFHVLRVRNVDVRFYFEQLVGFGHQRFDFCEQFVGLFAAHLQTVGHECTLTQNHQQNQIFAFALQIGGGVQPFFYLVGRLVVERFGRFAFEQRQGIVIVHVGFGGLLVNRHFEVALCQLVVFQPHVEQSHGKHGVCVLGIFLCFLFEYVDVLLRHLVGHFQRVDVGLY